MVKTTPYEPDNNQGDFKTWISSTNNWPVPKDNSIQKVDVLEKYRLLHKMCVEIDKEIKAIKERFNSESDFSTYMNGYIEGLIATKKIATKLFWDTTEEEDL